MSDWALAQFNLARLLKPEGDPSVQEFFDNIDRINALADAADGFVWRLVEEPGEIAVPADPLLKTNLTVWRDVDALFEFTYRTAHTQIMAKRRQWFERTDSAYMALWWIEDGRRPTVEEGLAKLWLIDRFGPTVHAFGFKSVFPAPDKAGSPADHHTDLRCVGNI